MQFSSTESNALQAIGVQEWAIYSLDIRELVSLQLLLSGNTVTEIAQHQRISRRYATRIIASLRAKFDEFFRSHLTDS
jgi:hypothetical protein